MLELFDKTFASIRSVGLARTLLRIARYPLGVIKRKNFKETVLKLDNVEDRFTEIYKRNYWGSQESVSGFGSTLESTLSLRKGLPELCKRFSIEKIFDAPCGDFNWIKYVLKEMPLDYTGGDIVAPLIECNQSKFGNARTKFIHIDLTKEKFPAADLMICRDCLFHLSYRDAKLVLQNFVDSGTCYFFATTHINAINFRNKNIVSGDFRLIDLFVAPFNFSEDVLFRVDDWKSPEPRREMCLWTREQIVCALEKVSEE